MTAFPKKRHCFGKPPRRWVFYVPKARPVQLNELSRHFQWLHSVSDPEDSSLIPFELPLRIAAGFTFNDKDHRKKVHKALIEKEGWLVLKLLTMGNTRQQQYLLAAAYTDSLIRVSYDILSVFFSSLGVVRQLDEEIPEGTELMEMIHLDLSLCSEVAAAHFTELRRGVLEATLNEVTSELSLQSETIENRLKQIWRGLAAQPANAMGLTLEQGALREQLMALESASAELHHDYLDEQHHPTTRIVDLLYLRWSIRQARKGSRR